jgi:hypothetical protein
MRRAGLRRRLWFWLIGHLGPAVLRLWFVTIRMRWHGGEYAVPSPSNRRNAIFVF